MATRKMREDGGSAVGEVLQGNEVLEEKVRERITLEETRDVIVPNELLERIATIEAMHAELVARREQYEACVESRFQLLEQSCQTVVEQTSRGCGCEESIRSVRTHLCELQSEITSLKAGSTSSRGWTYQSPIYDVPQQPTYTPTATATPTPTPVPTSFRKGGQNGGADDRAAASIVESLLASGDRLETGQIPFQVHLSEVDQLLDDAVTRQERLEWNTLKPLTERWAKQAGRSATDVGQAVQLSRQLEQIWRKVVAANAIVA